MSTPQQLSPKLIFLIKGGFNRGARKLLRPLVKKELMKSSIRESTPATHAKMRQSILNNLEKLKKITPILKKAQEDKERQARAENLIKRMKARMSIPVRVLSRPGRKASGSYDSQRSNDDFEEIEKVIRENLKRDEAQTSHQRIVRKREKRIARKPSKLSIDQIVVGMK